MHTRTQDHVCAHIRTCTDRHLGPAYATAMCVGNRTPHKQHEAQHEAVLAMIYALGWLRYRDHNNPKSPDISSPALTGRLVLVLCRLCLPVLGSPSCCAATREFHVKGRLMTRDYHLETPRNPKQHANNSATLSKLSAYPLTRTGVKSV